MLNKLFLTCFVLLSFNSFGQQKTYAELSKRLVDAVRYDRPYQSMIDSLENVEPDVLVKELDNDSAKKAFWINIYNAYIQIILTESPEKFTENRSQFFQEPQFWVACKHLSLEDIEHGIIRKSKARLGLGILPKLFPSKYEHKMRVEDVDARIHFALNCGARSCPPVAAYDYRKMDAQLDKMTKDYLSAKVDYRPEEEKVYVPKLLQWFGGDFGFWEGKKVKFLKKHGILPDSADPDIEYSPYDWTLDLDNFVDLES